VTRPIVVLHGALGDAAQMQPLVVALRDALGRDVIAFDLEGHGAAPDAGRPFRAAHFVENVLARLDAASIERADIVGYSMGGYVGLALARAHPARVTRVFTHATKFRWTPEVAERETRMLDARAIETKVPRFAEQLRARHVGAGWEHVLERTSEMMHALGDRPDLDDAALSSLALPVRVCVGDRDTTVSPEESAGVVRLMRQAELEVLPRTPHPFEKVRIARLASSIAEFLAD
jgi:pimeloyl-ACP methyl ester carboxylesterase